MTGFVVDADTPGIVLGKKEINMGTRVNPGQQLIIRSEMLRYPNDHFSGRRDSSGECIGVSGRRFQKYFRDNHDGNELTVVAMKAFDITRPLIASAATGVAQRALEEATKYAQERKVRLK